MSKNHSVVRSSNGENPNKAGQIPGHKTPRMTQRYAHLSPEYMARAVGKLDGIMQQIPLKQTKAERLLGAD